MCLFSPNTDVLMPRRSLATPDRTPDRPAGFTPAAPRDDLISLLGPTAVLSRVTDLVKIRDGRKPLSIVSSGRRGGRITRPDREDPAIRKTESSLRKNWRFTGNQSRQETL
jgi:hypothetical protein